MTGMAGRRGRATEALPPPKAAGGATGSHLSARVRVAGWAAATLLGVVSVAVGLRTMAIITVQLPRAFANVDVAFDFTGTNQHVITGLVAVAVAGVLGALFAPAVRSALLKPAIGIAIGFSVSMTLVAFVVTLARLATEGDIGFWFIPFEKAALVFLGSLPLALTCVLPEAFLWVLIMRRWTGASMSSR